MKVAFVSTLYAPNESGGAERTVRVLAEGLVARGHQAVVISLAPDGVAREAVLNDVHVYYVPLANLYWKQADQARSALARLLWQCMDAYNPIMGARVGRILQRERPDVLQTSNLQGFSVAAWRAAARLRIPLVQMLHDYYLACPNSCMFKNGVNCVRQCTACYVVGTARRRLSHLPAAVISLSRRVLQRLEGSGLFTHVAHKVVINGADNSQVIATPRHDKSAGSPLVVGYLGRMESTKGIEVLLDAVALLPQRQVSVLLGGKGSTDYLSELRRQYPAPNIQFLGFVKPAELFKRIDALVVPSVWEEPLGRVIYEGFAHGVPAIVSNVGGMPEIVDIGRTGFVFESGNADDLAQCLRSTIDAGWRGGAFFAACVERSRDFHVDRVLDKYLRVWETAAAAGVAGAAVPELTRGVMVDR
jgi:glycosyltransferase involved in cell wall biosynthesis